MLLFRWCSVTGSLLRVKIWKRGRPDAIFFGRLKSFRYIIALKSLSNYLLKFCSPRISYGWITLRMFQILRHDSHHLVRGAEEVEQAQFAYHDFGYVMRMLWIFDDLSEWIDSLAISSFLLLYFSCLPILVLRHMQRSVSLRRKENQILNIKTFLT